MALTKPKALLIDFDGVIRRWPRHDAAIEQHFGLEPGSLHTTAFALDLLMPAVTGAMRDEEWRARVASRLAGTCGVVVAEAAVAAWSQHPGEIDADVRAVLARCRPDLRIVLVSNATSRLPQDLAQLGLAQRFFAVVSSYDVRAVKPDAAIFREALRRAGVEPGEALFVDDSAANVDAATHLSIAGHRYTGHGALAAFLREHGALAENAND